MEHSTTAQRIGIFLAIVEACVLGVLAALHAGFEWTIGGARFAAPFLYPAAIVEAVLAVVLVVSIVLPGATVRAGRVLAAQILVLIGVFASQVALLRGVALSTARGEIVYGVVVGLALTSIVSLASPMMHQRMRAHR
jgi:hypothetical protein